MNKRTGPSGSVPSAGDEQVYDNPPFPGFLSSQFTGYSPSRPLVQLGLELRLVLEYPGEVKESRGQGSVAWRSPEDPTQALKMCEALSPGFQDWQSQACSRRPFDWAMIHFGFSSLEQEFRPTPWSQIHGMKTPHATAKLAKAEDSRMVAWFATNKHWRRK